MDENLSKLLEKDKALLPLLKEGERRGNHLRILFKMAHSSILYDKAETKVESHEMKAFEYLVSHLNEALTPDFILNLYGALNGQGKGQWKQSNNYFDFGGPFYITLPHDKTPKAIEDLCNRFAHLNHPKDDDFKDIFLFILHFICIHPLQDGNGRMSAFLLQFLLYKVGLKGAIYLPIDPIMNGLYSNKTTVEIQKASGNYYGKKELDLTSYYPYMVDLLERSYDLLILSLK